MKFLRSMNAEDKLVTSSLLIGFSGIMLGAALKDPDVFGIVTILMTIMVVIGTFRLNSPRLKWLLLFGLTAGVLELWADWLHVSALKTLVYTDYFGFKIFESPSYMPIGWWLTCVQFGYFALRLSETWSAEAAAGIVAVMGMIIPPWYEEFAKPARAWYYTTTHLMISNTPLWIILTYGGCMFGIATLAMLSYAPGKWERAFVAGIFTAAGFMFSAVFWYTLLG